MPKRNPQGAGALATATAPPPPAEIQMPEVREKERAAEITGLMMEPFGTGWLQEMPDLRDFTEDNVETKESSEIGEMASKLKISDPMAALPSVMDLRTYCSPIENQGSLGSCTAQAAVGVVEYFERRAHGRYINGSRGFVYKCTRNLLGWSGDTGAYLRSTMGALALCGVAPERYWPYTTLKHQGPSGERTFDTEPPAFVYALADNFEAMRYFRHDRAGTQTDQTLASVKRWIAAKIPAMFGFYGFPSASRGNIAGAFPHPCPGERAIWGHAVVAVGYDDNIIIKNTQCGNVESKGALLIRNSWGTAWGDQGYGWLPYDYVLKRWANDFWSLSSMGWVETGQFGL